MPSFFVPARSARHRRACFALYRHLIRQGVRVPLPDDLTAASPLGPENPIKTLVRNAFRRNRRETSPRLVVSALKNGYRFLTLLSRAAATAPPSASAPASASDAGTPERAAVVAFLRANQARVLALREKKAAAAAARVSTRPIEGRVPLIRKVSAEGEPPVYEPTGPPRPLSSFRSGVRKPPTLSATGGLPFLRLKKPQPRFLERVLRQRARRRADRLMKLLEMQTERMEEAAEEDQWERLVERMLAAGDKGGEGFGENKRKQQKKNKMMERGTPKHGARGADAKEEPTYSQSLSDAVMVLGETLTKEADDLVARGKAMWQIVLAEREMALQEEKERLAREGREGERPRLRVWRRPIWGRKKRRRPAAGKRRAQRRSGPSDATQSTEQQGQKPPGSPDMTQTTAH